MTYRLMEERYHGMNLSRFWTEKRCLWWWQYVDGTTSYELDRAEKLFEGAQQGKPTSITRVLKTA